MQIPILLYHSVTNPNGHDRSRYALTRDAFQSHLNAIADSGRIALTIGQIAAGLRGERELPEHPLGITFDDGYENTPPAVDLLCARGLRATVYVTTGQIGKAGMIRHDQLRQLAKRPEVQLGAHTVTHPRLDELSTSSLRREVLSSKYQLEYLLGGAVETFAYPHGAYDGRAREVVIDAGFTSAAAVKNALSHPNDDPWAIARWTVRDSTSAEQIARVLDGHGILPAQLGERLRTRGYRTVRRVHKSIRTGMPLPWR